MRRLPWSCALVLGLGAGLAAVAPSPTLTMEAYLSARWPSRPAWAPDGKHVSFLWTDWVTQDLYVVAADGGAPRALTQSTAFLGGPTWNSGGAFGDWSPDGTRIAYTDDGNLVVVEVSSGRQTRLIDTADVGAGAFSPDGSQLAFVRGGQVFVMPSAGGEARRVSEERVGGPRWSPDGTMLAVSVGRGGEQLRASPAYSGPLLVYLRPRAGQRDAAVIPVSGGALRPLAASPDNESVVDWARDSQRALVERISIDMKQRDLLVCAVAASRCETWITERDEKYLGTSDRVARFLPDGRGLWFTSDRDGWTHAYVLDAAGATPRQITKGRFEVSDVSVAPDGRTLYYASTQDGAEQRQLYTADVGTGRTRRLAAAPGVNTTAALSPRGDRLAYIHSSPSRLPDLWTIGTAAAAAPRQLTDSMTPALKAIAWQTPEIVTYAGEGGLPIRAQLFVPPERQPGRRYPAIVHVHQAALYQEAYLGSGPHKDNVAWYGWHQRLAQLGYVVLNVDYRGSYGYGRDFRVANHLDVGVGDAADVIAGVRYLESLGYVDRSRVGVYGMSYGGHMVLTLLSKYPDVFKAGINIAGVYDFNLELGPWDIRNAWMYARMGSPEDNPKAYHHASAINFIDAMKAPVMTLHGTNDTNVTFLQSIKLVDDLLRKGKSFEFEVYPGEVHFFGRRTSWIDAFGKMERFFVEHMGPPAPSAPEPAR